MNYFFFDQGVQVPVNCSAVAIPVHTNFQFLLAESLFTTGQDIQEFNSMSSETKLAAF